MKELEFDLLQEGKRVVVARRIFRIGSGEDHLVPPLLDDRPSGDLVGYPEDPNSIDLRDAKTW